MTRKQIDPGLKDYAVSKAQIEKIDAVNEHGSFTAAARALGCDESTVRKAIRQITIRATQRGYAPDHGMVHPVPEGMLAKGISTLVNKVTGEQRLQWLKWERDNEQREEALRSALAALQNTIEPVAPRKAPVAVNEDLCCLYTITDYHLGMLASSKEAGEPWDLAIAEQTLIDCLSHLLAAAPDAAEGIIGQLGDFLHFDSLTPVTPTSGHVVDASARYQEIVEAAVRVLIAVVDMALLKHKTVRVLLAEGNHDITSSVWLRVMFALYYADNPRVTVETGHAPYYAHQFGKTMIGWHHGHLKNLEDLDRVFAAMFPEMWGNTSFRYGHSGHRHHKRLLERGGMIIKQHQTLAPKDSHSARGGYSAERGAECTVYHRNYGEIAQHTVRPEMIAALDAA